VENRMSVPWAIFSVICAIIATTILVTILDQLRPHLTQQRWKLLGRLFDNY
jgi:hypothetical protein